MPPRSILLLTNNRAEELALRAIFAGECDRTEIEVLSFLTPSGILGIAEYSLLEHPDRPVALVLNAGTDDQARREERRDTIHRILSNASPVGWHVALAVPGVDAWLLADPVVREKFEGDPATRSSRHERAARIGQLARHRPIEREAIGRAFPDFKALRDFLGSSVPTLPQLA